MGSIGVEPVYGEFTHAVVSESSDQFDPWTRNYGQPPPFAKLVPRRHQLTNIRPLLEDPDYNPSAMLKTHGFAVARHQSKFVEELRGTITEEDMEAMRNVYHPEMVQFIMEVTGARRVFIVHGSLREGASAPSDFIMPVGLAKLSKTEDASKDTSLRSKTESQPQRFFAGKPIRAPHMDATSLGLRQETRHARPEIVRHAKESGVVSHEDAICAKHNVDSVSREGDDILRQQYNTGGQLGPRYAMFSIWRPLRTVNRDPLCLAPVRKAPSRNTISNGRMYWPYLNKLQGHPDVQGDYLREFAMLGVTHEEEQQVEREAPLEFCYVPKQTSEEVLFIKLADSASLGDTEHAGAPWHASPEIGSMHGDQARQSVELRVVVFW